MAATSEAYFVPRSEILAWINSTLALRLTKVEEVSGSVLLLSALLLLLPPASLLTCC